MSQASVVRYTRSKQPLSSEQRIINSFLHQSNRYIRHLVLSFSACAGFRYLNRAGHIAPAFAFVHTIFENTETEKEGEIDEVAVSTNETSFQSITIATSMDDWFVNIRPQRDVSAEEE